MFGLESSTLISVLAAVLVGSAPAGAATVAYSSGLANPGVTLDFSGLTEGSLVAGAYAGVTFNGLYVNSTLGSTLKTTTAPAAVNFSGNITNSPFSFTFTSPQSDVVFFLFTDGYGATITSSLAGATVETVTVAGYHTDGTDYFGFTGSSFDTITFNVTGSTGAPNTGNAVLDNVQIGQLASAVPEPGSTGIMLAGLAGLIAVGGRRRI